MPASTPNLNAGKIIASNPGRVWINVPVPAASGTTTALGSRITLTNGIPDAPAIHIGYTEAGASFRVAPTFTDIVANESAVPIASSVTGAEAVIEGTLLQVMDSQLWEYLTPGIGTKGTGVGYEALALGLKAMAYTSVAVIWETQTAGKFAVFQLYNAANTGGFAGSVDRTKATGAAFSFRGNEVAGRVSADTFGMMWQQI